MIPVKVFKKGHIPFYKGKKMNLSEDKRKILSDRAKETAKRLRPTVRPIEETRRKQREYILRLKNDAFDVLGNKCVHCGFSDKRALQIDHINGGGVKELSRRKPKSRNYKGHYYNHVKKSVLTQENKYQLLCANCNWIKRVVNKECFKKNDAFEEQELEKSEYIYPDIYI